MGHPLTPDLSKLSNEELTSKYNDLMKRHNMAFRWGNASMTGQLQLLIQDYQEELQRRQEKAWAEMEKTSRNFKNIIDIQ